MATYLRELDVCANRDKAKNIDVIPNTARSVWDGFWGTVRRRFYPHLQYYDIDSETAPI